MLKVKKKKQNLDKVLILEDVIFMLVNCLSCKQLVPLLKVSSLDDIDEQDDLEISENHPTEDADKPPRYEQNTSSRKRKRDIESSLIDFLNTPIPEPTIPIPASEPNPDMSFFQSILPSLANFSEDQKLEFRSEVLNIIKRLRSAPPHNYGHQQANIQYNTPAYPTSELFNYSSQPISHQQSTHILPTHNFFNYLHRPPFQQAGPMYSQPRPSSDPIIQTNDSGQYYNPISPSSTNSSAGNIVINSEENNIDIFKNTEKLNIYVWII